MFGKLYQRWDTNHRSAEKIIPKKTLFNYLSQDLYECQLEYNQVNTDRDNLIGYKVHVRR